MNIKSTLQVFYFEKIKYRKYDSLRRRILVAFELGYRARRTVDQTVPDIMKVNIQRVIAMFADDFEMVRAIDKTIKEMQTDYEDTIKELDEADRMLWGMVFREFVRTHTDNVVSELWGVDPPAIAKLRDLMTKLEGSGPTPAEKSS